MTGRLKMQLQEGGPRNDCPQSFRIRVKEAQETGVVLGSDLLLLRGLMRQVRDVQIFLFLLGFLIVQLPVASYLPLKATPHPRGVEAKV